MATITVRKNNSNPAAGVYNEPDFTTALEDLDAVTQIIYTTILLFQGEWWEYLNSGTPLFQQILGVYGATPATVSAILQQRILSVPYVTGITGINCSFTAAIKAFSFSASVETQFGTVTISFPQNGSSATIGTA